MTAVDQAALIDRILAAATLAEKVGMMSGHGFFAAYKADGGVWAARPYRAGSTGSAFPPSGSPTGRAASRGATRRAFPARWRGARPSTPTSNSALARR
jgi:hypothetical protein